MQVSAWRVADDGIGDCEGFMLRLRLDLQKFAMGRRKLCSDFLTKFRVDLNELTGYEALSEQVTQDAGLAVHLDVDQFAVG